MQTPTHTRTHATLDHYYTRTCGPDGRVHAISEKECPEQHTGPRGETTVPFFRPSFPRVTVKGENTGTGFRF